MGQVTLSSRLNDKEHGRPVVQGLRDLADLTAAHDAELDALTTRVLKIKIPTIAQIAAQLQVSGSQPLNITELIPGGSASTGGAEIHFGSHGARLALVTTSLPAGSLFLETDRLAVYYWTGTAWVFQINTAGLGDVLANIPTGLGVNDKGFLFWATDYARVFVWTGTVWQYAPGELPTLFIAYQWVDAIPTGWKPCDGGTYTFSKADATTQSVTVPDFSSSLRFARANSAHGGTGGSTSYTTGVNGTNTTVQAGAGTDVAAKDHTHGITGVQPPYIDLVPIIKL